jgi:hypothetical protein
MVRSPKKYFWDIIIAVDQLINTFFGGSPYETMSSRMGRNLVKGNKGKIAWRVKVCKILSIIDPRKGNHCENSIGV